MTTTSVGTTSHTTSPWQLPSSKRSALLSLHLPQYLQMRHFRSFVVLCGLALLYVVAGKLGLLLAVFHPSATPVWPPTGISLAVFLLLGYWVWPAIFLGAFAVNLTTAGSIASSLGIATGNTLEGLVGAFLVNHFANGRTVDRK